MRKRRRHVKNRKVIFTLLAVILPLITAGGIKAVPVLAELAESIDVFSGSYDEPLYYTGEQGENIFFFEEDAEDIISEGYGWTAEVEEKDDSDKGAKPYPEKWKVSEKNTVYKNTFEHYSGFRFFSLETKGQVKNLTDISNGTLLKESKLLPEFTIEKNGEPEVLIMHTHTTESFEPYVRDCFDPSFNYRTTDENYNVVSVGEKICEGLEAAGIGYIHDKTIHDYPSYNGSYERSAVTVKKILEENPSIKVVLDIHHDAIGTSESIMQPVVEIDGKEAAQIMIISGCDDGTMNMPDYMHNFRFASLLQQQLASDYDSLARPILFDYRKYNQDLTTGSLLIEMGSHGNTIEQVEYAGELFGRSLARALLSIS